jgi:hypothetical protein
MPTPLHWLILRGFLVDCKPDASSKLFREGLKVYPLSKSGNPPAMQFINSSKASYNTIHANNFEFYQERDPEGAARRLRPGIAWLGG